MNKIAIAFGWGKESGIMLKRLLKFKPILICCLGEDDGVDDNVAKIFGNALDLKVIIIHKSFSDYFEWSEIPPNLDLKCTGYNNTILKYFKNKKKLFDILYVGRRKKDVEERTNIQGLPSKTPKIKGVEFPLWNMD